MAVVVVRVGGAGSEPVDVNERAGIRILVGIFVIGAARVIFANIDGPVGLEGREIISGIEIEVGAVGVKAGEEALVRWAVEFSAYDGEVGVDVTVFSGYVLSQRIVSEVIGVALNVVAYFEVTSLPASQGLGHEWAVCHRCEGSTLVANFDLDGEIGHSRIWRWRVSSEIKVQELMLGLRQWENLSLSC